MCNNYPIKSRDCATLSLAQKRYSNRTSNQIGRYSFEVDLPTRSDEVGDECWHQKLLLLLHAENSMGIATQPSFKFLTTYYFNHSPLHQLLEKLFQIKGQ